jgi:hypothetical protein
VAAAASAAGAWPSSLLLLLLLLEPSLLVVVSQLLSPWLLLAKDAHAWEANTASSGCEAGCDRFLYLPNTLSARGRRAV